jgi:hypothetical protein
LTGNAFESSLFHTFEQQWYLEDFLFLYFIKQFVNNKMCLQHILNQYGVYMYVCMYVCMYKISPPFKTYQINKNGINVVLYLFVIIK